MKVTFADFGANIASSRLRAAIPQRELEKLGVKMGRDVLIYGKHLVTVEQASRYKRLVYDVCDDHYQDQFADYYRANTYNADLVTCNSETMRDIIKAETGRDAIVIPDPYESEERAAGIGSGLLWYGHESNLVDLHPYLDLNPEIITGPDWSREKQLDALERCAAVLIPTGKSMAKSANRLIEAVRNGRFVVAGYLPAHEEFKDWMWIGDIRDGVEWVKEYPKQAIKDIKDCQAYIRETYSPERIARLWLDALGQL